MDRAVGCGAGRKRRESREGFLSSRYVSLSLSKSLHDMRGIVVPCLCLCMDVRCIDEGETVWCGKGSSCSPMTKVAALFPRLSILICVAENVTRSSMPDFSLTDSLLSFCSVHTPVCLFISVCTPATTRASLGVNEANTPSPHPYFFSLSLSLPILCKQMSVPFCMHTCPCLLITWFLHLLHVVCHLITAH